MSILNIFKRNKRLAASIDQLNRVMAEQDAAFWQGEYENATGRVSRLSDDRDALFNQNLRLRAALIQIRDQGINSTSGTAVAMARKAKAALK